MDDIYNLDKVISYNIFYVQRNHPCGYQKMPLTKEELYQIAYMGYLKAKANYKPEYGKLALSYVDVYIRQELLLALRKEHDFQNKNVSPNMVVTYNNDRYDDVVDYAFEVNYEAPEERDTSMLDLIESKLHLLNEYERQVVSRMFLSAHPERLVDIATDLKVSKQRIHQVKDQAIQRLKALVGVE